MFIGEKRFLNAKNIMIIYQTIALFRRYRPYVEYWVAQALNIVLGRHVKASALGLKYSIG